LLISFLPIRVRPVPLLSRLTLSPFSKREIQNDLIFDRLRNGINKTHDEVLHELNKVVPRDEVEYHVQREQVSSARECASNPKDGRLQVESLP
jgi:hypothetical protein